MASFAFEILVEEIPHGVLPHTTQYLKEKLVTLLKSSELKYDSISYFVTPRRLAFVIEGLPTKGGDQIIEQKGPSLKAAYDDNGNATRALEGFLASYNVSLNELEEREIKGQKYLFIQKTEAGLSIEEILQKITHDLIQGFKFTQPMRWNKNNEIFEFIRPVRNIMAMIDDKILPMEFFGLQSTNYTHGHRQFFAGEVVIPHATKYEQTLKSHYCVPSFEQRQEIISSTITELLKPINGIAVLDEELLSILASLTELPNPILASFDKEYLSLPKEVLISEMKIHQKYVPIIDNNGALLPYYVIVANIPCDDDETRNNVITGNNKVLLSRFADGQFFFNEDTKKGLEFYAKQLSSVAFVEGAGSMQDKVQRMLAIGEYLRSQLAPSLDKSTLHTAISLAKADLNSLMVGEFPELQGIIGSYYATQQNLPKDIALSIKEHYYPMTLDGESLNPTQELSAIVGLADRIDNLLTLYAVGKTVTGSRDPYALRRQTIAMIHILMQYNWQEFSLNHLFQNLSPIYQSILTIPASEWQQLLEEFIKVRLEGVLKAKPYEYSTDTLNATLSHVDIIVQDVAKVQALDSVRKDHAQQFASLIELFKRLSNILKDEIIGDFHESLLQESAEKSLFQKYQTINQKINALAYQEKLVELVAMETEISQFFDTIMVKVGGDLQKNRIALLAMIHKMFMNQADFSKLS